MKRALLLTLNTVATLLTVLIALPLLVLTIPLVLILAGLAIITPVILLEWIGVHLPVGHGWHQIPASLGYDLAILLAVWAVLWVAVTLRELTQRHRAV